MISPYTTFDNSSDDTLRRRFPLRAARRKESELGREAGGGWTLKRAPPPFATTDPRETAQCRWPQRFAAARTLSSHICSALGLDDDRYVIERFQSKADGEIRPRGRNGSSKRGRGKASREIVSLSTVQRMRPERDEIIICTGVNCTTLGVQYWGDRATGLFVNGKYR